MNDDKLNKELRKENSKMSNRWLKIGYSQIRVVKMSCIMITDLYFLTWTKKRKVSDPEAPLFEIFTNFTLSKKSSCHKVIQLLRTRRTQA